MKGKMLLGLTAILMLTGAAVPVKADDVWKFDAQRFVLKEYTGTETDVVVPDTMDEGVPVKTGNSITGWLRDAYFCSSAG